MTVTFNNTLIGKSSPWGTVQDEEQIADGIIYVSTASHGGIWVDRELMHRITKEMKDYAAYWSGSSQWFEEDCDGLASCSESCGYPQSSFLYILSYR